MIPFVLRFALAMAATGVMLGGVPAEVNIWPGTAPGEKGNIGPEHDTTGPQDGLIAGKPVIRLGNVSTPTVSVYHAPAGGDTGAAVLVCPGGGYFILAMDLEGTEVCEWLNSIGVTGVLLKYRVPKREGQAPYLAPLQDAQRAVGLMRAHAKEWGIDPGRIGVLGFSAGGHVCAALSASPFRKYPRVDASDDLSCVPDFQVLVYPGGLVKGEGNYSLGDELKPSASSPPTFLAMAEDDPAHAENVLAYAIALKAAKVPMELHLYPTGGHGYGLRPTKDYVTTWPQRAADWMKSRGILARN
jgi:acetyl esterase/lipase